MNLKLELVGDEIRSDESAGLHARLPEGRLTSRGSKARELGWIV